MLLIAAVAVVGILTELVKKKLIFRWTPKKIGFITLFFILIGIGCAIFLYGFEFNWSLKAVTNNSINSNIDSTRANWGSLGDFAGGILNPILAFAAFIGLLITIWMQQKSIDTANNAVYYAKQELAETKKGIKEQNEHLEIQNETMQTQKFENTFFKLMESHQHLVEFLTHSKKIIKSDGMRDKEETIITTGRKCFLEYHFEFWENFKDEPKDSETQGTLIMIIANYVGLSVRNAYQLGLYFRNLYNIVKYVDESEIRNKKRYTNLLRAQLSSYEMAMLFYNCIFLYEKKRTKFAKLINRYKLFEDFPEDLVHKQFMHLIVEGNED